MDQSKTIQKVATEAPVYLDKSGWRISRIIRFSRDIFVQTPLNESWYGFLN